MERKLKHLELVQGVINRLSTNSFLLKGWSVTLVSALFALSASSSNVRFAILAFIPSIVFWGLDGYFLAVERTYRKHYDQIRQKEPDKIDFSMDTSYLQHGKKEWTMAVFSKTLIPFYGGLASVILLVMFFLR